ncbi:hypothetical protein Dsin_028500 [Dipteronia sinensis]|uniref:RNase H type-1 domain-containing protein n=1 Tax=Dipteronia sinensis TaxID=43782 RepID=A0AAD9ZR85_9ROSI|nr:hypothetical protein Dsin_028500 [Dipteronia sinensis]
MDGMYKVNNDNALNSIVHCVGVGVVVRNNLGLVMAASLQRIEVGFTPKVVEALAILRRVSLVVDAGLVLVVVESNAVWLVKHINASSPLEADVGLVVSDILHSIRIGIWSLIFTLIKTNVIATIYYS